MNRRIRTTTISVVAVASIIFILQLAGLFNPLRGIIEPITSPISRLSHRIAGDVASGFRTVFSINSIAKENEKLHTQVDDLKKQLTDLKEVAKENEQLRSQLNFNSSSQYNLVATKVIGTDPDSFRTVLQIDKGSSSGITEGMAVISNGALVGIIDSVSRFNAKILAVNDPVFKITALAQDSRADGIVRGQLGTGLKMERISQNVEVKSGETVVTAGSGQVPKGIRIGEIENIEHADNGIFQAANIASALKINSVEIAFVITGTRQ